MSLMIYRSIDNNISRNLSMRFSLFHVEIQNIAFLSREIDSNLFFRSSGIIFCSFCSFCVSLFNNAINIHVNRYALGTCYLC